VLARLAGSGSKKAVFPQNILRRASMKKGSLRTDPEKRIFGNKADSMFKKNLRVMAVLVMLSLTLSLVVLTGCPTTEPDPEPLRTGKEILEFKIGNAAGVINQGDKTIAVEIPSNATDFSVDITVSAGAQVSPTMVENFSGKTVYRVTAENGDSQDYIVTVTRKGALDITTFDVGSGAFPQTPITLSGTTSQTITAAAGYDRYQWFVDSEVKGTEQSIVLNASDYSAGKHRLVLVVFKNGVPYSSANDFFFTVQ
jgi:hypothetical protein